MTKAKRMINVTEPRPWSLFRGGGTAGSEWVMRSSNPTFFNTTSACSIAARRFMPLMRRGVATFSAAVSAGIKLNV